MAIDSISSSGFNRSVSDVSRASERIASGLRINSAADDAAGSAISERINAQLRGFDTASRNTSDGISLAQTALGDLSNITESIQRLRELSIQAANGTLSQSDRDAINAESAQIKQEVTRVVDNSNFNGVPTLTRDSSINIQTGPNAGDQVAVETINFSDALENTGFNDINLSSSAGASESIAVLDQMLNEISSASVNFGASINRFESTINSLGESSVNAAASQSRIRDADMAREISKLSSAMVMQEANIAMKVQANAQAAMILKLLG